MANTNEQIETAEKRIARILADLEHETGMLIGSLKIADIEITEMNADRREFNRRVQIDIKPMPGHNWET